MRTLDDVMSKRFATWTPPNDAENPKWITSITSAYEQENKFLLTQISKFYSEYYLCDLASQKQLKHCDVVERQDFPHCTTKVLTIHSRS